MKKIIFIALVTCLIFTCSAFAEDTSHTFRIKTACPSSDWNEMVANRANSYINKELRGFGDVVVTDVNHEFEIIILTDRITVKGNRQRDNIFAITMILTTPESNKVNDFLEASIKMMPEDELENYCKGLIATFDTEWLEGYRKAYQDGTLR